MPLRAAILFFGWATFLSIAPGAASDAPAGGFRVEEVAKLSDVPVDKLKAQTIAFSDAPEAEVEDAGFGLMRFDDWARMRPLQKRYLSLYPDYNEPMVEVTRNGITRRFKEKLHVYVAQARFVLDTPPGALDLARFVSLPFVEKIDPAISHSLIKADQTQLTSSSRARANLHPQRPWCLGRATVICVRSRYNLEGKLPIGIRLANKLRETSRQIAVFLEFESELAVVPPEDYDAADLAALTGLNTPVAGVLEQNIFYVNQVMQFGKLLAVFQPRAGSAGQTVATLFIAIAVESNLLEKKKEYAKVPVLRNLVPAQVLAGKSSFNTGNSISAGLPIYARNQIRAIAALLQNR